jgi:hypothetical protein
LLLVLGKNRRDGLAQSQQFIRILGQWISFHYHFRLLSGSVSFRPILCKSPQNQKALKENYDLRNGNQSDFKKTNDLVR